MSHFDVNVNKNVHFIFYTIWRGVLLERKWNINKILSVATEKWQNLHNFDMKFHHKHIKRCSQSKRVQHTYACHAPRIWKQADVISFLICLKSKFIWRTVWLEQRSSKQCDVCVWRQSISARVPCHDAANLPTNRTL